MDTTMDHQNEWVFTPDMFYPPDQQSLYSMTMSNHHQRQTRVVKPTRYSSPQNSTQRRSGYLNQAPTRTRSVVDRRPTFPQWQAPYSQLQSRPISWHPSSVDQFNQPPDYWYPNQISPNSYLNLPFTDTEINDVITPLSLPLMDEPRIHEMVTPLDELSNHELYRPFDFRDTWSIQADAKESSEFATHPYQDGLMTQYDQMYNQFTAARIETAPGSPDFLPIQTNAEEAEYGPALRLTTTSGTEELVGIGLYNSPAEVQSSLLFGSVPTSRERGSIGKGLKLEDSFEPLDTEDDGEEQEESSDDDQNEQPDHVQMSEENFCQLDIQSRAAIPANQTFYFGPEDVEAQYVSGPSGPVFGQVDWQTPNYSYGWI